jgi:UDP-N-acetylmuramate dehydrogenase
MKIAGTEIRKNEPMSLHTTFKTGGPADMYAEPENPEALSALLTEARKKQYPVFILGGGANLLVADKGIRGLVVSTRRLRETSRESRNGGHYLSAGAGLPISEAAAIAADADLEGLDSFYAMPGSVGGAVWMNARCYGVSLADVLESVSFIEKETLSVQISRRDSHAFEENFAYKSSPFQPSGLFAGALILKAVFRLRPGSKDELWERMRGIEEDRRAKGHFLAPCAGSIFKNNRALGEPTGKILDKLGFRNFTLGGAKVSPLHANIIINEGKASSSDIRRLIETMQKRAETGLNIHLEPEIIFAGEWT